jgi:hypothetical protein
LPEQFFTRQDLALVLDQVCCSPISFSIRRILRPFFNLFNLFNRANFGPPPVIQPAPTNLEVINSSGSYVPLAGKILATQTPGRVIQFALKVIW